MLERDYDTVFIFLNDDTVTRSYESFEKCQGQVKYFSAMTLTAVDSTCSAVLRSVYYCPRPSYFLKVTENNIVKSVCSTTTLRICSLMIYLIMMEIVMD